jgi:hypothetical protein
MRATGAVCRSRDDRHGGGPVHRRRHRQQRPGASATPATIEAVTSQIAETINTATSAGVLQYLPSTMSASGTSVTATASS